MRSSEEDRDKEFRKGRGCPCHREAGTRRQVGSGRVNRHPGHEWRGSRDERGPQCVLDPAMTAIGTVRIHLCPGSRAFHGERGPREGRGETEGSHHSHHGQYKEEENDLHHR